MPALLGKLHARHPAIDVRLRLATAGSAGLAHALLSGDLDVAFLSLPERKPAGIEARELATVPLVPVLSAAHPLAQRGEVALADLAGKPFVDFPPGYGNRELVDRAFAAAGVVRRVALEVPDINIGAALVRHGLGTAFLPAFAVARTPGLHVLHVLDVHDTMLRWSNASRHVVDPAAQLGPGGRCATWSTSTSSPCDARTAAWASVTRRWCPGPCVRLTPAATSAAASADAHAAVVPRWRRTPSRPLRGWCRRPCRSSRWR
ncbi:LysR substrate-binding domain-containing protein [Streptomyces sp. NPDC003343]